MRGLERGDLAATDTALTFHLDRCLGCRACEPVCPSGVRYGQALETARERLAHAGGVPWLARAALWALTTPGVSGIIYGFARLLRGTGIPRLLAGWGRIRFAMGMLAATKGGEWRGKARRVNTPAFPRRSPPSPAFLFRGCVMQGLFRHVHGATIRTLQVNGYDVREVAGQVCCGALHAHAGLGDAARELARANIGAFGGGDEPIVVNSAGCGAFMKEYGHVIGEDGFAARVRDVTELLAANGGPVSGGPLDLHVAYDPPCHLLHAQRVAEPPQRLFAAIPLLRLVTVAGANDCCGSAGLFTLVEPEMSRTVLQTKLDALGEVAPQVVATGNPGCTMQIGAGLAARGIRARVRHPVELLDASYRAAGRYE
jgi:glycolate oxidase iron-sulfur subunit